MKMNRFVGAIAALMLVMVLFPGFQSKQEEHAYVDLGLPSGTLWATCNIGADSPEEYGSYFAWGEIEPKETFHWRGYRFYNEKLTKYCNDSKCGRQGYVDRLLQLESCDDAATANWGSDWHIPTVRECNELIQYCKQEWMSLGSVKGISYTGPNGNSIFLPAASFYDGDELDDDDNSYGYYWLSSLRQDMPYNAQSLGFFMGYSCIGENFQRYYGLPIRPVRSKK